MGGKTSRRFCGQCGSELPEQVEFCGGCGRRIPDNHAQTITADRPVTLEPAALAPADPLGPPATPPPQFSPGGGWSRRMPAVLGVVLLILIIGGATAVVLILRSHHAGNAGTVAGRITAPRTTVTASASAPASTAASASAPVSASGSASAAASSAEPTEQQAAQSLATLLAQSVTDRGAVVSAASDVSSCGPSIPADETTFRNAASSRQRLLTQLNTLAAGGTLPSALTQDLASAWRASIEADRDFVGWAADERGGCSTNDGADPNFAAATGPDDRATTYKQDFVGRWNPLATQYGLPAYQWSQL
jgi:hypothetical protein